MSYSPSANLGSLLGLGVIELISYIAEITWFPNGFTATFRYTSDNTIPLCNVNPLLILRQRDAKGGVLGTKVGNVLGFNQVQRH